jgi:hypothetical protein
VLAARKVPRADAAWRCRQIQITAGPKSLWDLALTVRRIDFIAQRQRRFDDLLDHGAVHIFFAFGQRRIGNQAGMCLVGVIALGAKAPALSSVIFAVF